MVGAVVVAGGWLAGSSRPAAAWAATVAPPAPAAPPPAKAVLLVDMTTGRELYGQNEHVLLPPASLTKMLTAMIAVDWLPPGAIIPVSARAARVFPDKMGMKPGQRWPETIALHALLISSANDAAYALAERVSGTVERFAVTMGVAATQLGMTDHPVLRDPAGLDGTEGVGGGNLMSAWDVAIAARALMANPALARIVALKSFRFTGPDRVVYALSNHNREFLNSYPGAIGVKTGYTARAGVCLAEAAVRGGRILLAIIMNGVSPDQTAAMLLDKGFAMPVAAESGAVLPPVHQPAPLRPTPSRSTWSRATDPVPSVAQAVRPLAAPTTVVAGHPQGVLHRPAGLAAALAGAGALVLAACVAGRRLVTRGRRSSPPTRPGGAGSRH
jgi:D-alanyl-D-alanine carboxypeptidase